MPSLRSPLIGGRTCARPRRSARGFVKFLLDRLFERLCVVRRGFVEAYQDFTKAVDLSELALDPEELFEGARDTTPGRDVRL